MKGVQADDVTALGCRDRTAVSLGTSRVDLSARALARSGPLSRLVQFRIHRRRRQHQRREDAIDSEVAAPLTRRTHETAEQFQDRLAAEQRRRRWEEVGDIPPPAKYTSADFQTSTCWRLRGALDVPKECFISYPFCSREADPALLIGWAGWNHLQQAKALAAWYTEVTEQEGWPVERLKPLLAGLEELIPWLKQGHNDLDPEFHERMGDFFETFLQGQLQRYGLTRDDLKHWTPPAAGRPRRSRRSS
jgi:hypothetical protein